MNTLKLRELIMEPVNKNTVHLYSSTEIAAAIKSNQISAEGVVQGFLNRIQAHDSALNSFVYLDVEKALEKARETDKALANNQDIGLLGGVPFGVKDFTNVKGMPTYRGSFVFGEEPQVTDDPIIEQLCAAGAIPLGKTNVPEFGVHSATYNDHFGVSRNPWNLSLTPGGSSGGSSAAVSAALVPFATGTDGGGSIRTPAAFCGLVGLKTTHALIPRGDGRDMFSCQGFLTTTVTDTACLLDITAGTHLKDKMAFPKPVTSFTEGIKSFNVEGMRAAWSDDFGYAPMEPEVVVIAKQAYEKLLSAAKLQPSPYTFSPNNVYQPWILDSLNFLADTLLEDGIDIKKLDQRTQGLLQQFSKSDPTAHIQAQRAFTELEAHVAALFDNVDLLFTPATACAAFGADQEIPDQIAGRDASWTGAEPLSMFANVAWIPAISIPAGITSEGLPVGLQISTRRHQDATLLRLAYILEQIQPWPRFAPNFT